MSGSGREAKLTPEDQSEEGEPPVGERGESEDRKISVCQVGVTEGSNFN